MALLEIKSIVLKHPKKRTSLLPHSWSIRYGSLLGRYSAFVQSHVPDVFQCQLSEYTGLLTVELTPEFIRTGYLACQLLVNKYKVPEMNVTVLPEDPQYEALSRVLDVDKQTAIAGGTLVIGLAADALRTLMNQNPSGCTLQKARGCLVDAGILPLPLEWFPSILVTNEISRVRLRKTSKTILTKVDDDINVVVERLLNGKPSKRTSLEEIEAVCRLPNREAVVTVIQGCSRVFYEPGMVFPPGYFEELVEGYLSPGRVEELKLTEELVSMSPIKHLARSILEVLDKSSDNRIPTEYILAWCAALDIKPRLIWQCLEGRVFWSAPASENQVLLRKGSNRRNTQPEKCELPRDVLAVLLAEIRRQGDKCTLDKLVGNLRWGKGSANRNMYGPLPALLSTIPDVFFDPDFMYAKVALEDTNWPLQSPESASKAEAALARWENDYANLSRFKASMAYYLPQVGNHSYPLDTALESLAVLGLVPGDVVRVVGIFVPGSAVYLRKLAPEDMSFPSNSIEYAVIYALRKSKLHALDFESLIKTLLDSQLFKVGDIDVLRETLLRFCGEFMSPTHQLAAYCFYNPSILTLTQYAAEYLLIEPPLCQEFVDVPSFTSVSRYCKSTGDAD